MKMLFVACMGIIREGEGKSVVCVFVKMIERVRVDERPALYLCVYCLERVNQGDVCG
ncbi:hypothetical protein Hanom_Chr09g00799481 [Helianthus anomalus]